MRRHLITSLRVARRLIVGVVGTSVVLFGVALLVLPGPASVVIPLGLAILATEFVWARALLKRVRERASSLIGQMRRASQVGDVGSASAASSERSPSSPLR